MANSSRFQYIELADKLSSEKVWLARWCGREDSNFHGLSPTTTSTLRVYQFRHDRTREKAARAEAALPSGRARPLAKHIHAGNGHRPISVTAHFGTMVNGPLTMSSALRYDPLMLGPLILLAASVSPSSSPSMASGQQPSFQATGRASARATVTIRVISGVRFGADQSMTAPGADRRSSSLADASGILRPAELLEFQ
jgi:hypothetical protein